MIRKLIKQGGYGLTVYVPQKWVKNNQLKPGDEIEFEEDKDRLIIHIRKKSKIKKELQIDLKNQVESSIRTILANTYRSGYDKIKLLNLEDKDKKEVLKIVEKYMLGFEIDKNKWEIESISEPSYENFENLLQRVFYDLSYVVKNFITEDIEEKVASIQKYDNFLKRAISKNLFNTTNSVFLWQLLSDLNQISRLCLHFKSDLKKLTPIDKEILNKCIEMMDLLVEAYLKKGIEPLKNIHKIDKEILKIKNKSENHKHINMIARLIYISNSPLMGWIMEENNIS
ncbi:AbrB/MazE/SpoVT family DNA-binding domain-containing protein [Candidatus Woesearchaeota archaeon]|nr:AbrB/MazE/SpoVT family DNA-binding domain-containing protein [Candidatus Woesearchaeota archaeon]